jgi:hypothetical protein
MRVGESEATEPPGTLAVSGALPIGQNSASMPKSGMAKSSPDPGMLDCPDSGTVKCPISDMVKRPILGMVNCPILRMLKWPNLSDVLSTLS